MFNDEATSLSERHCDSITPMIGIPADELNEFYDRQAELSEADLEAMATLFADRADGVPMFGVADFTAAEDQEIAALNAWYDQNYRDISDAELDEVTEMINRDHPMTFPATMAALEKLHAGRRIDRMFDTTDFAEANAETALALNVWHDRHCKPLLNRMNDEACRLIEILDAANPATFDDAMAIIESHRERAPISTGATVAMGNRGAVEAVCNLFRIG